MIELSSILHKLHLRVGNTKNLLVGVHNPNSVRLGGVRLIEQGQWLQEGQVSRHYIERGVCSKWVGSDNLVDDVALL